MTPIAATGFAAADQASPELAAEAVREALASAGWDYAHSVILFLSSHFCRTAQPAITAASRAARCLQVAGCTAPGVFTETSWALHQPAAAALVLAGPVSLGPPLASEPSLTFSLPEHTTPDWLLPYPPRYGTLASGLDDRNGGQVWCQGKLRPGRVEASFHGASVRTAVSRGLRFLSPTLYVTEQDGFEVFHLSNTPALNTLLTELPPELADLETLPLQRLCALVLEPGVPSTQAVSEGRYTLLPLLGVNSHERSVTLAAPLPADSALIWAWREPEAAEADTAEALKQITTGNVPEPDFALMFACLGRGPYFYQGHDRDLAQVSARYPSLPVIGVYGGGEIAPLGDGNVLLSYSTVFSLVSARV
ncbi:MAG TPA: FIST C-terminal domain-containing protein [Rhodocyclaceae bacterium]|nr:FIST C-terminal domain-containing protein [Rhodocyclaceae bacterium]